MLVNARGLDVYYEEAGSGRPLLLLHGWNVTGQIFKPLFFRLADSRKVRIIDLPGFGLSEFPPETWGTEDYAELVKDVINNFGEGPCDLLAHSFGARIAIRLARKYPDVAGKIALTGAAGMRVERSVPPAKKALGKIAKAASLLPFIGEPIKKAIYRKIGSEDYLAAGRLRSILVRTVNEDLAPLLPEINNETLLIWGKQDSETPLEAGWRMHEGLKNSRMKVIDDAGHYPFADQPEAFYKILKDFFKLPL